MRTLIIDDEAKARESLADMLTKHCPTVSLFGQADCVKAGLSAIKMYNPELIFLDINMPDGSGFDLLQQINPSSYKIIFTTAFEEFAIKAFKFCAIDYLLKPVNPHELAAAVERANHSLQQEHLSLKCNAFMANVSAGTLNLQKMVVKTFDNFHIINVQEIIRCEAEDNYTFLYFNDGKKLLVSKTLKDMEDLLSENGFFRIHKSHLINLAYLISCEKTKNGNVLMKDNTSLPLSPLKKQQLLEIIQHI